MIDRATPDAASDTTDLFEIIRTTRSMRRLKPDQVPNELIPKILEAGVCAERRKYAAMAVPGNPRSKGQGDGRSLVQALRGTSRLPYGIGRVNPPLA